MINILLKKIVKDHKNYENARVRSAYGIFCCAVSIILNILLAIIKIVLAIITNSVAVLADGINNLTDVATSSAAMVGFIFSVKNPDKKHPFGHGRIEYLANLLIAVVILFVATHTLWDAAGHILSGETADFSYFVLVILLVSILVKIWLGRFNLQIGRKISAEGLIAAGKESWNDVFATFFTLISVLIGPYVDFSIDGVFGAVVALLIIKTGVGVFNTTITSLLGSAPSEDLLSTLNHFVSNYDGVIGTHDLMIHDYGAGRRYLTIHAEVEKSSDLVEIHDIIDKIERDIYIRFKIKATIHIDPIDLSDQLTQQMKDVVQKIVLDIDDKYSIHDFRIRHHEESTMLIFDVVIPAEDITPHQSIKKEIGILVKKYNSNFDTLIQIDHSFY